MSAGWTRVQAASSWLVVIAIATAATFVYVARAPDRANVEGTDRAPRESAPDHAMEGLAEIGAALSASLATNRIFQEELTAEQKEQLVAQSASVLNAHLEGNFESYIALMESWGGTLDEAFDQNALKRLWPAPGDRHQIISIGADHTTLHRIEWTERDEVRGVLHRSPSKDLTAGAVGLSVFTFPDVIEPVDFDDDSVVCLQLPMRTLGGHDKVVAFWLRWSPSRQRWLPVQTVEHSPSGSLLPRMIF